MNVYACHRCLNVTPRGGTGSSAARSTGASSGSRGDEGDVDRRATPPAAVRHPCPGQEGGEYSHGERRSWKSGRPSNRLIISSNDSRRRGDSSLRSPCLASSSLVKYATST